MLFPYFPHILGGMVAAVVLHCLNGFHDSLSVHGGDTVAREWAWHLMIGTVIDAFAIVVLCADHRAIMRRWHGTVALSSLVFGATSLVISTVGNLPKSLAIAMVALSMGIVVHGAFQLILWLSMDRIQTELVKARLALSKLASHGLLPNTGTWLGSFYFGLFVMVYHWLLCRTFTGKLSVLVVPISVIIETISTRYWFGGRNCKTDMAFILVRSSIYINVAKLI